MRAAISLGNSGNLSGGQMFLALGTGHTINRYQWVLLPMPPAVIARVNLLGKNEPSILTFTNRYGREIGDHPQDVEPGAGGNDDDSVVKLISDVIPGVDPTLEEDAELPGVDTDFDAEPTGVEIDSDYVPQELTEVDGFGQQDPSTAPTEEPSAEPPTEPRVDTLAPSPKKGMAAWNARNRKQPEKYVPSMKGNKYNVAHTQIVASLKGRHAMSMAQMSVKLMAKGEHRKADTVGMIAAQLSMKAAIKKWGQEAEYAITKEMKQLYWRDSYKPKHWHELTKKQKKQILESHIFVEQKRDGLIKARKVIGGNKQQDYITKEDVSSLTVTAEAVMLTCVIDAQEDRDIAVVDIPNAFVQTIVDEEDAEHRVIVHIRGPLVDILVSIVPDLYGPYVTMNKSGQKVLIVECLNAFYGRGCTEDFYKKKIFSNTFFSVQTCRYGVSYEISSRCAFSRVFFLFCWGKCVFRWFSCCFHCCSATCVAFRPPHFYRSSGHPSCIYIFI